MAKKTLKKKVPSKTTVSKLADPVFESARDIWLAGLGAFSVAQQESGKIVDQGSKMFEKLVSEGAKLEKDTRKAAEAGVAEVRGKVTGVRGEVENKMDSARKQVQDNWDKLETVFEDRVARVLGRLGVPTADEVRELTKQVETLNAKVVKMGRAPAKKAAPKKAAKKADVVAAYHLLPKDDGWTVRLEGSDEDLSVHGTKNEALDAARGVAQAHEPSRLVVHKADGTIQTSYNYGEA